MDEGRDVAAQIEQGMELDGGLATLERRPREQGEAEVDGGGVERIDGVVKIDAERVIDVQAPGDADQGLGEVGMDAPVALLVCIGQGCARDMSANAHVVELGALGAQTGFDITQTFTIGKLRERHAQILIETGKALDLVVAVIALDAATEAVHGKVID